MAAYEPDPAHGPWEVVHQVLRFPQLWGEELHGLYRRRWSTAPVLPVRSLSATARAIAPGLIAIARPPGGLAGPAMPLLHAQERIPDDVVMALINAWAWSLAPAQEADQLVDQTFQRLEEAPPHWEVATMNLLEQRTTSGGTAEPARELYTLLPERLAARLADRAFRTAGGELRFRVVSGEAGAEMVSWPPLFHVKEKRRWYYSLVITITVQTVPFADSFRVHTSTHLRRWATSSGTRPRRGQGAKVLFDVPIPWADLASERRRLIPNTMRYSHETGKLGWGQRGPVELLGGLDIMRDYPSPADLLAAPEIRVLGVEGIASGIVFSTGMGHHAVGTGLMPGERAEIDAWIEEGLAPVLRRVSDLRRAFSPSRPALLPEAHPGELAKDPESYQRKVETRRAARRAALSAALREPPRVEILWKHETTRDSLINEMSDLLGTGLQIHCEPVDRLVRPLELIGNGVEAWQEAVRARGEEVRERFGSDGVSRRVALTFVEIDKKDLYPSKEVDPKYALRLGFARAHRLTQFIQDAEQTDVGIGLRSRSACLDGLRQLGADILAPHRCGAGVAADLQYAGLWMIRQNSRRKGQYGARRLIAVRIRPDAHEHPVRGWDQGLGEWIPYSDLLANLGASTEPYRPDADEDESSSEKLARTVQQQIRVLLYRLRDRPTLLMVNSPNIRQLWPFLRNSRLVCDQLQFGGDPFQPVALYGPDLRVVLVRDRNGREETAQWHATGGGEPGFASGLWSAPTEEREERVFLSTTDAPPILRTLPRGLRKLFPGPEWLTAPRKTAWNPQALELTVLGGLTEHGEDSAVLWAALAHQSRFHNDHQPLSLPYALQLARQAEEYVLPMAEYDEG
ncbi:pPIWI_RE module domain-containing protein [Streptosporangium saharense]|nr:DUF3962 domain-containing protein [Streptosporangium saharense]